MSLADHPSWRGRALELDHEPEPDLDVADALLRSFDLSPSPMGAQVHGLSVRVDAAGAELVVRLTDSRGAVRDDKGQAITITLRRTAEGALKIADNLGPTLDRATALRGLALYLGFADVRGPGLLTRGRA